MSIASTFSKTDYYQDYSTSRSLSLKQQSRYLTRADAGQRMACDLKRYSGKDTIVLAIPHGGVPVGVEIALALGCDLDIIVPRKIPLPFSTKAGYGAVTEDGVIVLNNLLVRQLQIIHEDIESHAQKVLAEIKKRQNVFRTIFPPVSVTGKQILVVDDGLASGYTMLAAIKSLHKQRARKVVAVAPVASWGGWNLVRQEADEVVCPIVSSSYPFAVAAFYEQWFDLTDEDVIKSLEEFKSLQETMVFEDARIWG
jgi:putative phosphoribosyl transferase